MCVSSKYKHYFSQNVKVLYRTILSFVFTVILEIKEHINDKSVAVDCNIKKLLPKNVCVTSRNGTLHEGNHLSREGIKCTKTSEIFQLYLTKHR